ncbi:alpha-L-rhamnosidase [Paenarthrobacter nicotinovorans]|uniref:glycoside hydrolase family 78 protein n=1 Tax=Micrococcaceae TaxID=1268 RepID=UPI00087709C3|nr:MULTISPECIES: glycoside hydrolase family 78 protein [Micrococcaceae]MDR6438696.1 alpha-L-rhamnosidase [Paenarthrobacter nicotinovorans]SCZ56530.1 alpha-L-rhamnosidase [Arthrobacter sp. UNCCL28]
MSPSLPWSARFIAPAAPDDQSEHPQPAPLFRRDFHSASVRQATLHVTALGVVEAYLNGQRLGDEVLAPGWTTYRHRLNYSTHDVTGLIIDGANTLGGMVGEGWARGRLGWEGAGPSKNIFADRPGLFMQLELDYGDHIEIVATDEEFRTSPGPVLFDSIYDGERYDARKEQPDWSAPGFDASSWALVEVIDWDLTTLEAPTKEPVRRIEEIPVQQLITTPTGKTIADFGQNLVGWVRLNVEGKEGTTVTLRHAEVLDGGELGIRPLRTAKATDEYTLRGSGPESWEPRFTFHGFRYAEIEGYPGELTKDKLTAVVIHTDMARTGWFETSNPLLNQFHSNTVWSMKGNFVSLPTDCPQRDERLGWTGDINVFGPTAAYLYDVRGVLGSWLRDLALEQQHKGYVPMVVPDFQTHAAPMTTAVWSDVAVLLPWTLYQAYGDRQILEDAYSSMTDFTDQVAGLLNPDGLWDSGFQFGDWLDPDAPAENPSGGKTESHLVAAAYFCRVTDVMAKTAAILGNSEDNARFSRLAAKVKEAFLDEYVTPSGRLANNSATAYALAITFDILNTTQKERAGDMLANLVAKAKHTISTGFVGTPVLCDALTQTGHLDDAYKLLLNTECPSFLYPVTMDATTIWERWDSMRPDGTINPGGMTSFNHYALGAVADWMHRTVAGLAPAEPGYKRILIAPKPGGDLTSASARHLTPFGEAAVSWRIADHKVTVDVTVPDGATADVVLPLHPENLKEQVGPGKHRWSYDIPAGRNETPEYSLDTTFGVLAQDKDLWDSFAETFSSFFPGVPLDANNPDAKNISIRDMLGMIPMSPAGLTEAIENVLTAKNEVPA